MCENSGRCRLTNDFQMRTKAECVCKRGYVGRYCEKSTRNGCLSSPCATLYPANYSFASDTQCVATSTGAFHCVCGEGLDGPRCEKRKYNYPFIAKNDKYSIFCCFKRLK